MKLQAEDKRKTSQNIQREDAGPEPIIEPASDRNAIARLAYSHWEARGGQDGTPEASEPLRAVAATYSRVLVRNLLQSCRLESNACPR